MPDQTDNKEKKTKERNIKIAKILAISCALLLLLNFIIISLIYSWPDWIALLIFSLLFIVPAYLSNAGMVIVGGGRPIDGGKVLKDGRRLFGDHKTVKGFIFGPLAIGIPITLGIFLLFYLLWPFIQQLPITGISEGIYKLYDQLFFYEFYFLGGPFPIGILLLILRVVLVSYGACIGDLIGSFLKRRVNIASGEPFWIIDQIDFATFAILFGTIPALFFPGVYLAPDIYIIIFLFILTPSVSIIANTVAYVTGLKDVPW